MTRRLSVGTRLGLGYAAISALLVLAALIGFWTLDRQADLAERIDRLERLGDDIDQIRIDIQSASGWQGLVAADVAAYGYETATGPDGYNRQGFLEDKENVLVHLDAMHTEDLTQAEATVYSAVRPTWEAFYGQDDVVMATLAEGTPAALAEAMNSINDGPAGQAYGDLLAIADELDASVTARTQALHEEQEGSRSTGLISLGITLAVSLVAALVLAIRATRSVVRPLGRVVAALDRVADGDLTARVEVDSGDELGRLGTALNHTTESLSDLVAGLTGHASTLASASGELTAVAAHVSATALETSTRADSVAESATAVSRSVDGVAGGGDQMASAIAEIARNAAEAAEVAQQAAGAAERTNAVVGRLDASSAEIGSVLKVITSIAEQTNMLALNATIEAARAGEAGKGFAVVASEVKELAQETARATDDIGRRVQAIQSGTADAVQAIGEISAVIEQIESLQTVIAAAVEEQSATSAEMNRNALEAAEGSRAIADTIATVAEGAGSTTAGMQQSRQSAEDLARIGGELNSVVSRFRV